MVFFSRARHAEIRSDRNESIDPQFQRTIKDISNAFGIAVTADWLQQKIKSRSWQTA
jgi:hypothetical protein